MTYSSLNQTQYRCKDCIYAKPIIASSMVTCMYHHTEVYGLSVPCGVFDIYDGF